MYDLIIKTLLLAAFSDGEVQPTEVSLINSLRNFNLGYNSVSQSDIKKMISDISKKLNSGFEEKLAVGFMLEEISSSMEQEQRNAAYALAAEICASNHLLLPSENEFLTLARERFFITDDINNAVHKSIELRYGNISQSN